ncbi:hypothetical protein GKD59_23460 [Parabacteroides distasonis]|uniref:Uncharacterized protein n=1 Tax=Parabacteroides distasonis TaxID=823 RepID=A0A7K0GNP0_PARDI|nr:hypothetical protein [Parabacteroides distasonis]MRY60778.1 hypothetical protein [Parabacteroides distasonis]
MKVRELEKDELPEIPGVVLVSGVEFEFDLPERTGKRMHEINASDYDDK